MPAYDGVGLVREMASANPLWGAPRIRGELGKLGFDVFERAVSRLLAHRPRPPSQTWRTFLTNHQAMIVSMDFFTVSTRATEMSPAGDDLLQGFG
jgi:putative transposase